MYARTRVMLLGWWVAVAMLTSLPYIVGLATTPAEEVYLARSTQSPADTAAYWSMIEQSRQGRWLVANQFTSEQQNPSMLHPLWLVTGWAAAGTTLSTPAAFHVLRIAAIGVWLLVIWTIISRMWQRPRDQWLALSLVTFSSGLGWLGSAVSNPNTMLSFYDLWVAESNSFLSLKHSALFALSQAAMVWVFMKFMDWIDGKPAGWRVGAIMAILGLIHPYDLVTLAAVMVVGGIWALRIKRRTLGQLVRLAAVWWAMSVPVVAYYILGVFAEPAMRGWFEQNQTPTGYVTDLVMGFGMLLPMAGLAWFRRPRTTLVIVLGVWVMVAFVLMVIPGISFQRRLVNGIHIPVALLATFSLIWLRDRVSASWRFGVIAAALIVLAASNIVVTVRDIAMLNGTLPISYPARIQREEFQLVERMRTTLPMDAVVFSDVWVGNVVAGLAAKTVALGHGHQTIDILDRIDDWNAFRGTLTAVERQSLLDRLRVTHLVWRAADQHPSGYNPRTDPTWTTVIAYGDVTLLRREASRE